MAWTFDAAWLEAVLLASVRIVMFLFLAPPFAHRSVPARVKVMLAVGLSIAVAPTVNETYQGGTVGEYVLMLIGQLFIGGALGGLVALVFAAVQSAGGLIDLFGGFSLAQAFDPGLQVSATPFARFYQFAAVVLLFVSDGYQMIIAGLARTFTALPLGESLPAADPAAAMTTGMTQMFVAALQIAGPMIVVLFLADVGLGLITRVAPALNAFALGFPVKILLTVTLSATAILVLPRVVSALVDDGVSILLGVG